MKPNLQLKEPNKLNKLKGLFSSAIFYLSILIFIIGFNFSDTPLNGGWTQQFMPDLGGRQISDVFFLDSLTGWAVTPFVTQNDTTYVLKTTNGGDNWFIQFTGTGQFVGRNKIHFINSNTGFTCGNDHFSGSTKITKTTNGGNNWFSLNDPTTAVYDDMYVLSEDTIWLVSTSSLTGGVFRTTNGGASWDHQINLGSDNPAHIYMYNGRIGYISRNNIYIRKTTNSGLSWVSLNNEGFSNMYFTDSLIGWKFYTQMKKTTNGGLTWTLKPFPTGGMIYALGIPDFSVINKDTIISPSGYISYPNNRTKGLLFRTTDSGLNWKFQVPDTNLISGFDYIEFTDRLHGWVYGISPAGIHTTTGGDTNWVTGVKKISNENPKEFKLFQNYPNPFNPTTNIKYKIKSNGKSETSNVKLMVYNIAGKEIRTLINEKQSPGDYTVEFDASGLSSGVYFYSLIVDGKLVDTKKMILVK